MRIQKLAALLMALALALCLISCGTTQTSTPDDSTTSAGSSEPAPAESTPEEEPEPEPQSYELDMEDRMRSFGYRVSSSFEKETETNLTTYYSPDGGVLQVMYVVSSPIDLTDTDTTSQILQAAMDDMEGNDGVTDFTAEYGIDIADRPAASFSCDWTLNGTLFVTRGLYMVDEDGLCTFMVADADSAERLVNSFDSIVDSIQIFEPENDFLKDEETRNTVSDCLSTYDFDTIISLAQAYISEQNPAESDTVHTILQYAQEAQPILASCNIVTDEFEGDSVLYGGVEEISSSVNFVPFIENGSTISNIKVNIGFVKNGWLFMEDVKIKVGDDEYINGYFDYFDVSRDTLGGSTIQEQVRWDLDYDEAEALLNGSAPMMRFEGDDDATYDHEMTEAEINALRNVYDISVRINGIRDIILQWMDENVY